MTTEDHQNQKDQALALLPELKEELGNLAVGVTDKNLLKFLLWKPNVKRAADRFRAHIEWRRDNAWAFDEPELRVSTDAQVDRLIKGEVIVAPDSLVSKDGSAVLVGRLRNNDMKDGRTATDVCRSILYLVDRVLEREEAQLNGVVIFHDLNGITKNNVDIQIPKMLLRGIIGHFPIRIKGIYMLNPPWFFKGMFSVISNLLFPKKLKARTHFLNSIDDVYKFIDQDKLLAEHGGSLEFDVKVWAQRHREREENGTIESLHNCIPVKA